MMGEHSALALAEGPDAEFDSPLWDLESAETQLIKRELDDDSDVWTPYIQQSPENRDVACATTHN